MQATSPNDTIDHLAVVVSDQEITYGCRVTGACDSGHISRYCHMTPSFYATATTQLHFLGVENHEYFAGKAYLLLLPRCRRNRWTCPYGLILDSSLTIFLGRKEDRGP
jgi:hypothetical protein